jgi:hypothetical protein
MGMSIPTRLFGVFALTVAGLLLMGGPALASTIPGYGGGDDGPTCSLSASESSSEITANGDNFEPGEEVTGTVFSDPIDLGKKIADSSGRVSFTFSVRDLDPGEHRVELSADSGTATAFFTVVRDGGDTVIEVSDSSSDDSDDSSSDSSSSDSSSSDDSDDSDDSSSDGSSSNGSSSDDEDGLAFTGSNVIIPLSIVGALLLVGGGVAVVSSRRKRDKARL